MLPPGLGQAQLPACACETKQATDYGRDMYVSEPE